MAARCRHRLSLVGKVASHHLPSFVSLVERVAGEHKRIGMLCGNVSPTRDHSLRSLFVVVSVVANQRFQEIDCPLSLMEGPETGGTVVACALGTQPQRVQLIFLDLFCAGDHICHIVVYTDKAP